MKGRWVTWIGVVLVMTIALDAMAKRRITHEVSMVISGALDIDTQGRVAAVEIDHEDHLDAAVIQYIKRQVSAWVFQPVVEADTPVSIRTLMTLRLVLKPIDQAFEIRTSGVVFFDPDPDTATMLEEDSLPPPRYPPEAFKQGVGGDVYLAVRVDQSGMVQDVFVEQVNFQVSGDARAAKRWTGLLAQASVESVKKWKFKPFGSTPDGSGLVTGRIPVSFRLGSGPALAYGQWEPYFPGPKMPIPWPHGADPPAFSPDARYAPRLNPDGDRTVEPKPWRSFVPPKARLLSLRDSSEGGE